jgi:hypothetical protein
MNPENLSAEALSLFNQLPFEGQREAILLAQTLGDEEAVYMATLRTMPEKDRRRFLFALSKKKWGL